MAKGYQVFAISRFPSSDSYATTDQLTLPLNSEHELEVTRTSIDLANGNIPGFRQFAAAHDYLVKLRYPGRAQGKNFREYITPYKFSVFVGEETKEVGFQPLLVATKKDVAQDFVGRLNRKTAEFEAKAVWLDFDILRPRLIDVRGAWFGAIRAPNIASSAFFGPNVDRSDEFQHAETVGHLTNIMVKLEISGDTHMLMFAAEGGIVLYNAYQTEAEEVAVIQTALSGILAGCLIVRE